MTKKNHLAKSLKERWADGSFKGTTGRIMSIKERENHSKPLRGRIPKNLSLINSNKKGSGNPMYGKHTSQKQKDAARKTCIERWSDPVKSKEIRLKMSKSQTGEKGSNWKNGVTPKNESVRHGIEFRLWREAVFARDNWTCQKCNEKGGYLHPHHINNFAEWVELRFAIDNGITFCKKCHNSFHKKYGMTKNTKSQINKYIKL